MTAEIIQHPRYKNGAMLTANDVAAFMHGLEAAYGSNGAAFVLEAHAREMRIRGRIVHINDHQGERS